MPRSPKHLNQERSKRIPPWRGPMLLVLVIILVGVFFLQQHPKKTHSTKTSPTTSTTNAPANPIESLSISSGPTWLPLNSVHTLALDTSSLSNTSGVAVSLEVFPKIESRSQFEYISQHGVSFLPIATSAPISLSQLSQYQTGNPQLNFQISQNSQSATNAAKNTSTSYIQIPYCSPNCSGVYPILAVFVKNSQVVGTALTKVAIETSAKVSHPINFSLVAQAPFTGNKANDLHSFELLTATIKANPQAKITLDIPGIVLQEAMASTSQSVKSSLSDLITWAQQSGHQIIVPGFVPLNINQLQDSGLGYVSKSEFEAGLTELNKLTHKTNSSLSPMQIYGGLSESAASTLASNGITDIFLGQKYFLGFNEKYSLSQPFNIQTSNGDNLTVLSEDAGLKKDMTSYKLPYNNANQLSTDLAQIYFDQPNDLSPRILSASVNVSNSQAAASLNIALELLDTSPYVKTVDANKAFTLLPNSNLRDGNLIRPKSTNTLGSIAYQNTANTITALQSSLEQDSQLSQASTDLLASVASTITQKQAANYLSASSATLSNISKKISLASNKSFTVTSRKVQLPIAISSLLKVPFKGVLVINSDRLSFPHGNTVPVVLNGPNTTLSVPIYAETLGSYLISAKLYTTNGKLVVTHTSIEIRSTAFSLVSIILTLGAFLILALWWIRSLRKGYKRNKRLVAEKTVTS